MGPRRFHFALVVAFSFTAPAMGQQLLTLPPNPFPPPQAEWELPPLLNSYGYVVVPSSCEPYTYIAFNAEGEYEEYAGPNGSTYIRYSSTPQPEMDCDAQGAEFTTVQWWFRWPSALSGTPSQFEEYSDQTRFDAELGAGECYGEFTINDLDLGEGKTTLYRSESGNEEEWRTYNFVWPASYQEGDLVVLATGVIRFGSEACVKLQAMDPTFLAELGLIVVANEQDGQSTELPTEFALKSAYPNPFNPSTTIPFELSEASGVTLTVYDGLGRYVATLAEGYRSTGHHEVVFEAQGLPSGTYFYRLRTTSAVRHGRVSLVK